MDIDLKEDCRLIVTPNTIEEKMFICAFVSALASLKASDSVAWHTDRRAREDPQPESFRREREK